MVLKNLILSFSLLILLTACTSENKKADESKSSEASATKTNDSIKAKSEEKISFLPLDSTFIKENFKYKGSLREYIKWADKEGTHIVFTSETGVYYTDPIEYESDKQNAEINCFHYLMKEKNYSKKWSIYDYSKDCPVDALATFSDKNLEVTDLNSNGIPEIWTNYQIACRGDVSPSMLKLIMYEGDIKYKLQGESLVELNENEKYGGEIKTVVNFKDQQVFYDYAKKKWAENVTNVFE